MTETRTEKISALLKSGEAAVFTGDANRFYLTGFHSSEGTVVVTASTAYFLVDFRYFEKARQIVKSCNVVLCNKLYEQLLTLFMDNKISVLYVETGILSVENFNAYKSKFKDVAVSDDNRIEKELLKMRSIKSDDELRYIKQAQKLTDDTFSYILNRIDIGRTEREVMLDMEFFMRKSGSEGVSFDFIVVSGKNSSMPHGVPTDKRIESGDFVTMDFGAVVNGYRSDMTRTVAVKAVSDEQKTVYNTVLTAQKAAINAIKPTVKCSDVDKAAREIISAAGYGECFGHALGHSVGIEIHEKPVCSPKCTTLLEPGVVMTVEPGIYLENRFGVRIEDMVYVTGDGCVNITNSNKELIVL